jgi:hypothetical protein
MQEAPQWTAQEEETIARIMAEENVGRIEAIQAIQRRKKSTSLPSKRLKLQDPLDSAIHCQKRRCLDCASGQIDPEMAAFMDIMLNGKRRSGEYFLVQRNPNEEMRVGSEVLPLPPNRGLFPVPKTFDETENLPHRFNMSEKRNAKIGLSDNLTIDPLPNFALRGRGRPRVVSDAQKRLLAAERQARYRDKKAAEQRS